MTTEKINCKTHGVRPYCIVCTHLIERLDLGYYAIEAEQDEPAQIWCEACDVVLAREQGWTDEADAQAGWKLICTTCCDSILKSHNLVSWVEGSYPDEELGYRQRPD